MTFICSVAIKMREQELWVMTFQIKLCLWKSWVWQSATEDDAFEVLNEVFKVEEGNVRKKQDSMCVCICLLF